MTETPRKFDPANAASLDRPDRQTFLPDDRIVELLELTGAETVIDYGTGTGRLAALIADRLKHGHVIAVDEQPQMVAHAEARLRVRDNVRVIHITENRTGLPDGVADRVLAVNLLHEIGGEPALEEMRRLLTPGGRLVIVDWQRGRSRPYGPPDHILYNPKQAADLVQGAGLSAAIIHAGFPYHLTVTGTKPRHSSSDPAKNNSAALRRDFRSPPDSKGR